MSARNNFLVLIFIVVCLYHGVNSTIPKKKCPRRIHPFECTTKIDWSKFCTHSKHCGDNERCCYICGIGQCVDQDNVEGDGEDEPDDDNSIMHVIFPPLNKRFY